MGGFMKVSVVGTRLTRSISVSTCKEGIREGHVILAWSPFCSLPLGARGVAGWEQVAGGEESYQLGCSKKEAGAAELFQCVGMETG